MAAVPAARPPRPKSLPTGLRRLVRELRWLFKSPGKFVRGLVGLLLLLAALVGLALPLVPQVPFFLAGLAVLGTVSPRARFVRIRLRSRFRAWREERAARKRSAPS